MGDDWRAFNKKFVPIFMAGHPDKTKIGAGLACGALWTVSKGIAKGDLVISPDGMGTYFVGEVSGDYFYVHGEPSPHRRPVKWLPQTIQRADMSEALRNSTGSIGTVSTITQYASEIEKLIGATVVPVSLPADPTVEDPVAFAMEKHLEDFLVKNWTQTDLGKDYDIFAEICTRLNCQPEFIETSWDAMVAVMGWSPEQGANPITCVTSIPANVIEPVGPGTFVRIPTALLAKKLVRNPATVGGEIDSERCSPNVTTASSECLIRSIR